MDKVSRRMEVVGPRGPEDERWWEDPSSTPEIWCRVEVWVWVWVWVRGR